MPVALVNLSLPLPVTTRIDMKPRAGVEAQPKIPGLATLTPDSLQSGM